MSYGIFEMKSKIIYLLTLLLIILITSCTYQTKEKNVDSSPSPINLQKQTEGTYPVKIEEIKTDTDVDYEKPAPPLTPEERQRLIDSTEIEDKEDKK